MRLTAGWRVARERGRYVTLLQGRMPGGVLGTRRDLVPAPLQQTGTLSNRAPPGSLRGWLTQAHFQ